MERYTLTSMLNLILLTASLCLFVYIKWYFSTLSSNIRNRIQTNEILVSMVVGFVVYFIISNKSVPSVVRFGFLFISIGAFIGGCILQLKLLRAKHNLYPKSLVIFHQGKFYKGVMTQNKLSEKDILSTLKLKGVGDLIDVDTIIVEPDGELTVIYKEKIKSAA
jgi:uncharacterized membrane protein YcaP (DUF421 family)